MRLSSRSAGTAGALLSLLGLPTNPVYAHSPVHAYVWSVDTALVAIALLVTAMAYIVGIIKLWRASGGARGVAPWQVMLFSAGWLALVLALVSPLDALGEALFSAHMVQHEILMLVAAPLLVLGKPLPAFVWALRPTWRRRVSQPMRIGFVQKTWHALTSPLAAWSLHAIALWTWHIPLLFEAGLKNEWVHAAQHLSFLLAAVIFWWVALRRLQSGFAPLYVLTTAIHTGALGALLTFAPMPLYPVYAASTLHWGLSALEDQQLGGLIMWVPAGLTLVVAGVVLFDRWFALTEHSGTASAGSRET